MLPIFTNFKNVSHLFSFCCTDVIERLKSNEIRSGAYINIIRRAWIGQTLGLVGGREVHCKTNGRIRYAIRGRYDHSPTGTD